MSDSRYDRQRIIKGWDQESLGKASVALVGSGMLSDMLMADLLSLGVGRIRRIGSSSRFDFERINPETYIEQADEQLSNFQLAEIVLSGINFVIDATNSFESKAFSSTVAENKGYGYMSAAASGSSFSIFTEPAIGKRKSGWLRFHEAEYGLDQGVLNSMVCSAMVADELRKRLFALHDDITIDKFKYYDIREGSLQGKKILQIGAGAIGTFTALALAMMDADLTLIDFDHVEETNLNRQFLFYDCVGVNKAEALADRLRSFSSRISYANYRVEKGFNPTGFDYVFSCVDNNEARYYMNLASARYLIPLINGGSSIDGGNAMPYFPGKTSCLECQTGGMLSEGMQHEGEEAPQRAPGECFQPSLIIPNQIVGGLMVNCLLKALEGTYEKSTFMSGLGIYNRKIDAECFDFCKTSQVIERVII